MIQSVELEVGLQEPKLHPFLDKVEQIIEIHYEDYEGRDE